MSNLTVSTAVDTLMQAADQAAIRTAAGLGSAATHATSDFDAAGAASTAQAAAIAAAATDATSKANAAAAASVPTTRTVAGRALSADVTLVKGDVGLGNVDNTADASKPVSTAQAAADTAVAAAAASDATTKANAAQAFSIQRANHTGTQSADTLVNGTTNHVFAAAEDTKLSGITALADPTGTTIHAATAKTTPVDADEIGIIDSAASNVLKKTLWSSIKATLKSYFDGLYDAVGAADAAHVAAASDATTKANAAAAASIPIGYLDTDGTGAANSDSKVMTQKATRTLVAANGGGGVSGVTYTFTSGTFGAGLFSTNHADLASTLTINLSDDLIGQYGDVWQYVATGGYLLATDSSQHTSIWRVSAISNALGITFTVTPKGGSATGNWNGAYTWQWIPGPQTASQVGLGNVSNDAQVKVTDIGTLVIGGTTIGSSALQKASGTGQLQDAVAGADYLAPAGDGAALTNVVHLADIGITVLAPSGNGSGLSGITAAQVGALTPTGDGSGLAGITASQVGAVPVIGPTSIALQKGDGGGNLVDAVVGTDYLAPPSPGNIGPLYTDGSGHLSVETGAFTGSGTYSNFVFENGICLSAY